MLVLVGLLLLQPVVVVCRASTFDHLVLHVWCPGESPPSFCLSFSSFSFAGAMVLVVSPFFVSSCPSWYGGNVNRRERKVWISNSMVIFVIIQSRHLGCQEDEMERAVPCGPVVIFQCRPGREQRMDR